MRKYDGKDTVHFLDPPYTGYNAAVGEGDFDEQRFFNLLKDLKGKFLITYGVRGKLPKLLKAEGYPMKRIRTPRTLRSMRGVGGSKYLTQIVATNYDVTKKSLDALALDGWEVCEDEAPARPIARSPGGELAAALTAGPVPHESNAVATPETQANESSLVAQSAERLHRRARVREDDPSHQGSGPERRAVRSRHRPRAGGGRCAEGHLLGAEIRTAAHRFMEEFQDVGLMHKMRVNGAVKIVESYLAPTDLTIAGTAIKQGTWLLGVHVTLRRPLARGQGRGAHGLQHRWLGASRSGGRRRARPRRRRRERWRRRAEHPERSRSGGDHRLLDMLVEEVSLVDRAANKRRFLIVKRDAEMATKKKTEETGAIGKVGSQAPPAAAGGKTPPPKKKPREEACRDSGRRCGEGAKASGERPARGGRRRGRRGPRREDLQSHASEDRSGRGRRRGGG